MVAFVSEAALVSSQSQGLPEASSAEFPRGAGLGSHVPASCQTGCVSWGEALIDFPWKDV